MGNQISRQRLFLYTACLFALPIVGYFFGPSSRRTSPQDGNVRSASSTPAIDAKIENSPAKLAESTRPATPARIASTTTSPRTTTPASSASTKSTASVENAASTHTQAYTIKPEVNGKSVTLQTFCVDPKGNLWMACRISSSSSPSSSSASSSGVGALLVYEPGGELLHTHPLEFVPQAINFAPNGNVYIAGSGKIAKLASDGSVEKMIDAPNISNPEEILASAKKASSEAEKQMAESFKKQNQAVQEQLAKLEQAPEDEDASEKRKRETRIKLLQQQLKTLASAQTRSIAARKPSAEQTMARLKRSTAIAANEKDVFVSLPESTGYGYSVWRLDPNLEVDKVVLKGGRGCCGQFDIQTDGTNLIIAENTKFQVGVYSRDGDRLQGFGSKTRGGDDGFGSCCNPMNVRCCENGEILTAESSIGHIKRYSPDGNYLGFVGTAKVAGGCKHVAIGFDPERNYYYMMHEDLSHVAVLVPKSDAQGTKLTKSR